MKNHCGLLVVSFGTSYEQTRRHTLDVIEQDLAAAFPDRAFYRAWTSPRIIQKVAQTQGIRYDTVPEALERMLGEGISDLLIQPTHMLAGAEYAALEEKIRAYGARFRRIALGAPLIAGEEDVKAVASALETIFAQVDGRQMLALMGHGSAQEPFAVYQLLDKRLKEDGFPHFCVGTVEFEPGIAPVLRQVRARKPDRVYLSPLLVVAGDHALNDMAGDEDDSWKRQLEREGVEAVPILRGMGEYPEIRALYVAHAQKAEPIQGRPL